MERTIVIDAGHGGADPGATYEGRQEKDDALRLAMAVGKILENNGINVIYTRTTDEYETPFKKATEGNQAGADFFISIHRNSSVRPELYNGFETLVYDDSGVKAIMARNINANMEKIGFKNNGVTERPNLVVLKRTQMPALLLEVGFINSSKDNAIFDNNFDAIAQGIADGILDTLSANETAKASVKDVVSNNVYSDVMTDRDDRDRDDRRRDDRDRDDRDRYDRMRKEEMPGDGMSNNGMTDDNRNGMYDDDYNRPDRKLYRVQVGAYRNKDSAERMLNSLLMEGFPAFVIYDDGLYKVQVGAFEFLANAVAMEKKLRSYRYNTYITV